MDTSEGEVASGFEKLTFNEMFFNLFDLFMTRFPLVVNNTKCNN
jgi:hypothetical protein